MYKMATSSKVRLVASEESGDSFDSTYKNSSQSDPYSTDEDSDYIPSSGDDGHRVTSFLK